MDYEDYSPKPVLEAAIISFSKNIKAARALLQKCETRQLNCGGGGLSLEMGRMIKQLDDAQCLFSETTGPIYGGMTGALTRMANALRGYLVEWEQWVEEDNQELITTKLIKNPCHDLIYPTISAIEKAKTTADVVLPAFGGDFKQMDSDVNLAVHLGKRQLGAVSHCVAIYVTRFGTAKPATKKSSMNGSKKIVGALKIQLPVALTRKLEIAIADVDKEEKAAKQK